MAMHKSACITVKGSRRGRGGGCCKRREQETITSCFHEGAHLLFLPAHAHKHNTRISLVLNYIVCFSFLETYVEMVWEVCSSACSLFHLTTLLAIKLSLHFSVFILLAWRSREQQSPCDHGCRRAFQRPDLAVILLHLLGICRPDPLLFASVGR
jgi:hypothetical protein